MAYKVELFELNYDCSLVAEISELCHKTSFKIRTHIDIHNKDETIDTYELHRVDRQGGEICGWNFVCKANGKELLIIND